MTEGKGKGGRLVDELMAQPLTPEEIEREQGPRPALRLRQDALTRALDADSSVRDVLNRQTGEGGESLTVLRDPASGTTAVAVPLDQYLQLATSSIRDARNWQAGPGAQMGPSDAALSELGVEQVNPDETWT